MHQECVALGIARRQRIGGQIVQRRVRILRVRPGDRHVQQELRHRVGREERQSLQQMPARLGQLANRGLPGLRHRLAVAVDLLLWPSRSPAAGSPATACDTRAMLRPTRVDRRRRHFQRQRQSAEFARPAPAPAPHRRAAWSAAASVASSRNAAAAPGRQHVRASSRSHAARKALQPAGQQHVAAVQPAHQPARRVQRLLRCPGCRGSAASPGWRSASQARSPRAPPPAAGHRRSGAAASAGRRGWTAASPRCRPAAGTRRYSGRAASRRIRPRPGSCRRRPGHTGAAALLGWARRSPRERTKSSRPLNSGPMLR